MIKGIYVQAPDFEKVDASALKKAGITDIFVKANRITHPTYSTVIPALLNKTKGVIRVHAWITCFKDAEDKWIEPKDTNHQNVLINAITDIIKNYGINGIHLDYVRYSGSEKHKRAAYQQKPHGAETITAFAKRVSETVKSIKRNVYVSAAVMPETSANRDLYGQDYTALAKYLDWLLPMVYKGSYKQNTAWIGTTTRYIVEAAGRGKIATSILTYRSDEEPTPLPLIELKSDIKATMDNGSNGFVLFHYSILIKDFFEGDIMVQGKDISNMSVQIPKETYVDMIKRHNSYVDRGGEHPKVVYLLPNQQGDWVSDPKYHEMKLRWEKWVREHNGEEPVYIWTNHPQPINWREIERYTFDWQDTGYTCGPSSLKMLLSELMGYPPFTEQQLAAWAGTSSAGTDHPGLFRAAKEAANRIGIKIKTYELSMEDTGYEKIGKLIADPKIGVIAHIMTGGMPGWSGDWGHYVFPVAVHLEKKLIKIADPSKGVYDATFSQFNKATSRITWAPSLLIIERI